MISRDEVQSILEQVAGSWWRDNQDDDSVREYVVQMILTTLPTSQEDDDVEQLRENLASFVGPEVAATVVDKLPALCLTQTPTSSAEKTARPTRILLEENGSHTSTSTSISPIANKDENDGNDEKERTKELAKKDRRTRRQERLEKKRQAKAKGSQTKAESSDSGSSENDETAVEDDASAWQARQAEGKSWGGRGFGGRGEYAGKVNHVKSNIHLSNVTVSLPNGTDLLQNTTMDITAHRRYALIGRNGVGKSTLLHRLAHSMIPGMPAMRILLVQQQVEGRDDQTPVQVLLAADVDRAQLLAEQDELEQALESGEVDEHEIEHIADRLSQVMTELDAIGADTAENRALEILKGLQFTPEMLQGPTLNLSGGWRQRLALARALFVSCDLLLLDECTNHLDLHGLDWLIKYLTKDDTRTIIMVSHDRSFLDAVCTDVIRMDRMRLSYHPGNYSQYERQMAERAARDAQMLDSAERQRTKAEAFVQKQQAMANKKSADPNKQRQAKMIKDKKMDRIGNYREDGKRYKNFSLKQMDMASARLAQKVHIEVDEPVVKMKFPNPTWAAGIAPDDAIVRAENFSFGYSKDASTILKDVTVELRRGSKVALVGNNGAGKSTLVKLFAGDLSPGDFDTSGNFWRHANVRVGHVSQYTVEELQDYEDLTVVQYAEEKLRAGKASAEVVAKASGNVRQYLGGFGLGGRHALQKIGKLSGGERMRLSLATVMTDQPHVLFLDESTNHVDIETLDYMSAALNDFEGSVLMVSHNQAFLSGFCKELWILEKGRLTVNYSDTSTFDEVFSQYRSAAVQSGSLAAKRQTKALLSKKATKQSAGARQNAGLL